MTEIYRIIVQPRQANDPRSAGLLADAQALGLTAVRRLDCHDLYFIEGRLEPENLARLAGELLSDPITQSAQWGRFFSGAASAPAPGASTEGTSPPAIIEVALRPGVTDPVAEQIVRAARLLGIGGVQRAATGQRYVVHGNLSKSDLLTLTRRLLANNVIHHYALGEIEPSFPQSAEASGQIEHLSLLDQDEAGLLALSAQRRAALDLAEMQAIQDYYRKQGREPSDVEFETIAQTWSEHCVHKTFRGRITVQEGNSSRDIDSLLKTFIRAATDAIHAPWVRSAFVDNAGIIDFDEQFEVSFKVETHNHPSAIEPFGGANTGVGGVIRDVLGVSAKPIAATDVLCFGPTDIKLEEMPEGVLHPLRIRSGVVAGVQDYGNKIGIPTVNGAILYDPGFTANPLVFCGCVGLAPKGSHPHTPRAGDRVIVLGGRTGRDGLRGATFSSMTMDGQTGEVSGASVQIGNPITEKGLVEVICRARDQRLYHAITDCGAGGLSSAVGEMSSVCGVEIELKDVRLKYPGLAPWEIWLSEAQERMVLAVPPMHILTLETLCETFDVELTDIGAFNTSGRLVVHNAGQIVLELENEFLHHGIPQRRLRAIIPQPIDLQANPKNATERISRNQTARQIAEQFIQLLAHPDIASKTNVIRIYDHEVQGATVIKPLTGAHNDGPSDACVLKPLEGRGSQAIVLSNGINPQYGKLDAYRMAWSVVDEAIRNAVAVGANPEHIALLDNFCWGDPKCPETLGSLVEAARGCYDAATFYRTPFISGKDSLNNEYFGIDGQRHAIPPTLLISAIGLLPDASQSISMDLKTAGNLVYLVGAFIPRLVGSHWNMLNADATLEKQTNAGLIPDPPAQALQVYQALHRAIRLGLVRSAHDLSEGGLAIAAAEMSIGGRLGLELNLTATDPTRTLFGETNGCLLVEIPPRSATAFESLFQELPCQRIGLVIEEEQFIVNYSKQDQSESLPHLLISQPIEQLVQAWKGKAI